MPVSTIVNLPALCAIAATLAVGSIRAQSPRGFEIASIKRNLCGSDGSTMNSLVAAD